MVQSFGDEIVANEYLVPVLFVNSSSRELIATNMADYDSTNLSTLVDKMALNNDSILVDLGQNNNGVIYYQHSPELSQMKYFPFIQFFIIGLFVLIAYVAFSSFRKAEQDQVWVGMAKETAHQLGTPISSLMAWNQLLEAQGVDQNIIVEMNKDIERLNTVTNRFSKIGSDAILKQMNLVPIITKSVDYLKLRISAKIDLSLSSESDVIMANVNSALLEWVIENITKNAVDSMEGKGKIGIELRQVEDEIQIDITDTGKGIPANKLKTVFQPGYTTKKRGWGLGLSLVKRIVEDFHNGKVYVLKSELDKGTTFRLTFQV
ncbi:MAG: HAMP domain-containing histidine kinase [Flavobacteriales bacterium]|nr:HAMP domain-containing histidine kinase [Flavobacteriales bacterium]